MKKKLDKKIVIKVSNLSKSFDRNIVLKNINFELLEGESLAIIGASGSGKSVLLKNIIGLLKPDKGSIIKFNKASKSLLLFLITFNVFTPTEPVEPKITIFFFIIKFLKL